jgi:peptide/nickel transport system substrate-binding protein
VKNGSFYETGKPHVDTLTFEIIADVTALTNAVLSGSVEFSNEIPPKDWAQVAASAGLVGEALEGSRYYWLVPNNARPPLDNPKVRQAIAHAIDRQAIVDGVFFGQATPLVGGVIPEWSWAYPGLAAFNPRGDVEKAKALLKEAGQQNGFETSLTIASSFPAMVAMAPIIQANLAAIGITASISTMEVPRYWDEIWGPSNFDLTSMYWISPLADPDDFVFNNYACGTPINVQKSCSPEMDALLREGKTATTREARKAAYRKQQELALAEMPIVPLVNAFVLTAHSSRLKDFVAMRTGFLRSLRDVRLET